MHAGIVVDAGVPAHHKLVSEHKLDYAIYAIRREKLVVMAYFPMTEEEKALHDTASTRPRMEADAMLWESFETRAYPSLRYLLLDCETPVFVSMDFKYSVEGRKVSKVVLLYWCPDSADVKIKFKHSSAFQQLAAQLGVARQMEAHDKSDIVFAEVLKKVND